MVTEQRVYRPLFGNDLEGWTRTILYYPHHIVVDPSKQGVTLYADFLQFTGINSSPMDNQYVYQSVNFTGVNLIRIIVGASNVNRTFSCEIRIDNTLINKINNFGPGYTIYNGYTWDTPISGYTGYHNLYVGLTSSTPYGTGNTTVYAIYAYATILADFSISNSNPIVNIDAVSFTDTSTGAVSWLWDFGDGTTSNEQNPVHIYTTGGTKTVTLKINGGTTGDYVKTQSLTVQDPRMLLVQTKAGSDNLQYGTSQMFIRSGVEWL